jgi:hypothetical protein
MSFAAIFKVWYSSTHMSHINELMRCLYTFAIHVCPHCHYVRFLFRYLRTTYTPQTILKLYFLRTAECSMFQYRMWINRWREIRITLSVNNSEPYFNLSTNFHFYEVNREYGRGDPLRWPRDTLYPQKLAQTSLTSGGHSFGILRLRTKTTEFLRIIAVSTDNFRVLKDYLGKII